MEGAWTNGNSLVAFHYTCWTCCGVDRRFDGARQTCLETDFYKNIIVLTTCTWLLNNMKQKRLANCVSRKLCSWRQNFVQCLRVLIFVVCSFRRVEFWLSGLFWMSQKCLIASYISNVNTILSYFSGQKKRSRNRFHKGVIAESFLFYFNF